MVYEEQIPEVLKDEEQWLCWRAETRNDKSTKVPVDASTGRYAQVDTPETWSGFDTALDYYENTRTANGIGFVFHEDGEYAGVDLDDCRDTATSKVDDWAVEIIHQLSSYTERSPSGAGFHVLVSGDVPDGGNRRGNIEMYDSHRYFTVTGDHVTGSPTTVKYRPDQLQTIHDEYIVEGDEARESVYPVEQRGVPLANDDLIKKAMNAANGDKFQALWNGDTSGYKSHSEADQALCTILAFWAGGDPRRIEDLFSQSGLVRDKWRNRADYRERTINNAIQHCSDFYKPENHE